MGFAIRMVARAAYALALGLALLGWLGAAASAIEPLDNPIPYVHVEPFDDPIPW